MPRLPGLGGATRSVSTPDEPPAPRRPLTLADRGVNFVTTFGALSSRWCSLVAAGVFWSVPSGRPCSRWSCRERRGRVPRWGMERRAAIEEAVEHLPLMLTVEQARAVLGIGRSLAYGEVRRY